MLYYVMRLSFLAVYEVVLYGIYASFLHRTFALASATVMKMWSDRYATFGRMELHPDQMIMHFF